MRVAVTGASGYLGRPIVAALAVDERVEEVVAIDARAVQGGTDIRAVQRDVRDPALAAALDGADALVHLAFRVLGRGGEAESVNVGGSRNAFEAAARVGVGVVVHASSAAAYGAAPGNPVPFTEDHPLRALPDFYYPRTKVAVERMLDGIEAEHPALRIVRMRPVSTIGPGAPEIAGGRFFVTASDFDPPMQFTWIDDVVAAFGAALFEPAARGAYNVGAPGPVRASQVARLIGARPVRLPARALRAAAALTSALRLPGAMHPGWAEMACHPIVVDTRRTERELGWRPSCDTEEALRRYGAMKRAERNGARRGGTPLTTTEEAR